MDVELSRTYPVSRKKGFDFFMDIAKWGEWTVLEVADADEAVWRSPGDTLSYTYRPAILRFPMQGEATLDEIVPGEMVKMTLAVPSMPSMPVTCLFENAGSAAFTLRLIVHTVPPAGWWGDALERLGWLDGFIAQDMKLCLNRLEKVFHAPKEEMAA